MSWDPAVLRKYNTTGHFRLLNQLRSELKSSPLVRPQAGQTVGEANRSKALQRAVEGRAGSGRRGGSQRSSRPSQAPIVAQATEDTMHGPFTVVSVLQPADAGS